MVQKTACKYFLTDFEDIVLNKVKTDAIQKRTYYSGFFKTINFLLK